MLFRRIVGIGKLCFNWVKMFVGVFTMGIVKISFSYLGFKILVFFVLIFILVFRSFSFMDKYD